MKEVVVLLKIVPSAAAPPTVFHPVVSQKLFVALAWFGSNKLVAEGSTNAQGPTPSAPFQYCSIIENGSICRAFQGKVTGRDPAAAEEIMCWPVPVTKSNVNRSYGLSMSPCGQGRVVRARGLPQYTVG